MVEVLNTQVLTLRKPIMINGVEVKELTYDLHHSEFLEGNIMTEYESKFVAEGKPICRFVLSR